jgi:hypothetical protein
MSRANGKEVKLGQMSVGGMQQLADRIADKKEKESFQCKS